MAWLKLDDKRAMHRKFRRQGFAVRGLDEAAMCWCAHQETDGFVSDEALEDLGYHHGVKGNALFKLANDLVEIGRWQRDSGGWWIKDYLDFNPSRVELQAQREAKREAGRRGGIRSGQVRAAASRTEAGAS